MKRILLMMLIPMMGLSFQSQAQGDLLIAPTLVVFDGNKQKDELNLVNIGKDTATYSVSFVNYKMQEDGHYVIIDKQDSGQMFAEPYLRIFPRKVTLAPAESQVIMLQCRRKTDMPTGEYRSHIYFRSEKNYLPLGKEIIDTTAISIQLIPIFGVSIPIIIRAGEVNVKAVLSGLKLEMQQDTIPYLNLTINRTGNISTDGDISVQYLPLKGKSYQIGALKGIRVFTEIDKRNISIKLNKTPGLTLTNGKLKVQYISNGGKKRVVYAEEELELK